MAKSAAVTSGYTDLDVYGRGSDSIFGPGAREENARSAKIHLRELRDEKAGIRVRDVIDYDLYGRGDPRVFGKDAHIINQSEGRAHLKQTRIRNQRALRFLMIPARAKALVRSVAKKVKHPEQKTREPEPAVGTGAPGETASVSTTPSKVEKAFESPAFASTPKRVSSRLPSEEPKPKVEEGIVLQGIHSFNSEDDVKILLEDDKVEESRVQKGAKTAAVVGVAGAAAVGGTMFHLSSKDEFTGDAVVYGGGDSMEVDSSRSTSEGRNDSAESSDAELSASTSVEEESESATGESSSAEESRSASEENASAEGEEVTTEYDQDEAFADAVDTAVSAEPRNHNGDGVSNSLLDKSDSQNVITNPHSSADSSADDQGVDLIEKEAVVQDVLAPPEEAPGPEKRQFAAGAAMFGALAASSTPSDTERTFSPENPALVATVLPDGFPSEASRMEALTAESGATTKPSNRILDIASPTTPSPLRVNVFEARRDAIMKDMNESDDGAAESSERSDSSEVESSDSSALVSSSSSAQFNSSNGQESASQETSSQEGPSLVNEATAISAHEGVDSARGIESELASASSGHDDASSDQESAYSGKESASSAKESASSARESASSAQESASSARESASSARQSVSSAQRESDRKIVGSTGGPNSNIRDSSSEDAVEESDTATLSSSEKTMSEDSSEVALSSSDEVMTDSDDVDAASDDEFVDVVDNVKDLRSFAS